VAGEVAHAFAVSTMRRKKMVPSSANRYDGPVLVLALGLIMGYIAGLRHGLHGQVSLVSLLFFSVFIFCFQFSFKFHFMFC
jgi:hypothetical protein